MKRILVTILVLLSMVALIQFSPNAIIPVSAVSTLAVTLTAPANAAALTSTYIALTGKVVSTPALTHGVQVEVRFAHTGAGLSNNTVLCPVQNVTATGTFSCKYAVETAGLYIWNATAGGNPGGVKLANVTSAAFTFTANPIVYQIPLVAGWNLISLPIVPASNTIANVLASQAAGANFSVVWSYQGGVWKSAVLNPITHVLSGSLTTMQDGLGYWIYMTKADHLFVVGTIFPLPPATPPSYPLSAGWNLIGFKPEPTITAETVATYLGSLSPFYDTNSVWYYNNTTGLWSRLQGTDTLNPGNGLWIFLSAAKTLYP